MKLALIDLGTNSVRFFLYKKNKKDRLVQIFKKKEMVRLGDGLFDGKNLDEEAFARTLKAFLEFRKLLDKHEPEVVRAVATSALRIAKDREILIQAIQKATGIELEVISGTDEARLIALGVKTNLVLPDDPTLLIDIGGGSTELTLCTEHEVFYSKSLPIGAARAQQLFLKSVPPVKPSESEGIEALRRHMRTLLLDSIPASPPAKASLALGSSGSIRSLGRIFGADDNYDEPFPYSFVRKIVKKMSPLSLKELTAIPGLESRRADLILPAAIILEEVLHFFGVHEVEATVYALKDGLIEEIRSKLGK